MHCHLLSFPDRDCDYSRRLQTAPRAPRRVLSWGPC